MGLAVSQCQKALDDDEDESDELESETWSTMSSDISTISANGWRLDA